MRIALDLRTATDHFPGIGRYAKNLAVAIVPLLRDGDQVLFICQPGQSVLPNSREATGERVLVAEVPSSPFSLGQQWAVPAVLRRYGASLYHSLYYLMPYGPRVPTVVTIYDLIPLRMPHQIPPAKRILFRVFVQLALRTASHVVGISAATRRDLLARYRLPSEQVTVIPLAVDPVFRPQPREVVRALCSRLDLPHRYVLYVGSNKPHKNLVRLVEAWARMQPRSFPLVIAGYWSDAYPEVGCRIEALGLGGAVRLVGPVREEDLPALYSGALVFAFPSEYEGFGLPVLEAMACGVPVVAARVSSLPEVAGDAALFVDPRDLNALAQRIDELLGNEGLRKQLADKGIERARTFSWERCADQTLRVYKRVSAV
jgi:alpha-1,3-rhamnosyl/mannosyltransferase